MNKCQQRSTSSSAPRHHGHGASPEAGATHAAFSFPSAGWAEAKKPSSSVMSNLRGQPGTHQTNALPALDRFSAVLVHDRENEAADLLRVEPGCAESATRVLSGARLNASHASASGQGQPRTCELARDLRQVGSQPIVARDKHVEAVSAASAGCMRRLPHFLTILKSSGYASGQPRLDRQEISPRASIRRGEGSAAGALRTGYKLR